MFKDGVRHISFCTHRFLYLFMSFIFFLVFCSFCFVFVVSFSMSLLLTGLFTLFVVNFSCFCFGFAEIFQHLLNSLFPDLPVHRCFIQYCLSSVLAILERTIANSFSLVWLLALLHIFVMIKGVKTLDSTAFCSNM